MFGMLVLYNSGSTTQLNSICKNMCKDHLVSYATSSSISLGVKIEDFDLQSGDFFIAQSEDETHHSIPIPTKGSAAVSWFKGFIPIKVQHKISEFTNIKDKEYADAGFLPAKLLVKLNSYKHEHALDQEMNYTKIVQSRVIDFLLDGAFCMTLAYMTKNNRSRIIVSAKDRDLYFTLVYSSNYYTLVWSDNAKVAHNFRENGAFFYSMTPLAYGGTYVIHPKFLMSKWKKWRTTPGEISRESSALRAVSILENYLSRNTVKLNMSNEGDPDAPVLSYETRSPNITLSILEDAQMQGNQK